MILGFFKNIKQELALYLLVVIPTTAVAGYALQMANAQFSLLQNQWPQQMLSFGLALAAGIAVFTRRVRFVPVTALLMAAAWLISKWLGSRYTGEFDAYFWSIRFNTHALLMFIGWMAAYGFVRSRLFSISWPLFLLAISVAVTVSAGMPRISAILNLFMPVLLYSAYTIYITEFLRNLNADDKKWWWQILSRLAGFFVLMGLLAALLCSLYKPAYEAIEKEWGAAQNPNESNNPTNSLTRNDGSGTTNTGSMGLTGFNNKANKDSVLFVARLDNFFPDGKTPNPLYFTTDYYTRFDTETQTFETDSLRPYNDLFSPDVSQIPLYFTREDTTVLRKAMASRNRRIATAEVFKHNLSSRLFTAPSTSFFVQPISVPPEDRQMYKSAYRAKMLVSDLNSAYFVYNPAGDKALSSFQQQRFEVLRRTASYKNLPANFFSYYTFIPQGNDYDSIRALAKSVVQKYNAKTTIDQVLAVRDYFLEKDENGQSFFRYSDNPGVPGIPSANKLTYFLFQNKKGYCAYFAGASLFMLRALGIPSRIATGFLTIDRSSKNPGWYWFYEDQAHAWVQVYFPEYGWLDFDTTVPDAEQQQAPQPDKTPPLAAQTAWLVAEGKALQIDTTQKRIQMQVQKFLYWDDPYELQPADFMILDVSMANISHDTGTVALSQIPAGAPIAAVSYDAAFKALPPQETDSARSLINKFPDPAPIDEIKIMLAEAEKEAAKEEKKESSTINGYKLLRRLLVALIIGLILYAGTPFFIYRYMRFMAKGQKTQQGRLYWMYMASMFYLHQMGMKRGNKSPLQYAAQQVDPSLGTRYETFIRQYLKAKYTGACLSESELALATNAYASVFPAVRKQIKPFKRFLFFTQTSRAIQFFKKPTT
jgi:transglutaminase-like putative cysteine protease